MRSGNLLILFFAFQALFFLPGLSISAGTDYSVEIIWTTDTPSTSVVEYGEGAAGPYSASTAEDKNLVTSHRALLTGIRPSGAYHYRVRSRDAFGKETVSVDHILEVSTAAGPPRITGVGPANISAGPDDGAEGPAARSDLSAAPPADDKRSDDPAAASAPPVEKALVQKGSLLLGKGRWQLEPSLTYAHVSTNKISITGFTVLPILVLGEISSEKVKRDIFISSLSLRYGLLEDLQLTMRAPYRYQYERVSSAQDETTRDASGFGDMEAGAFYQLTNERGAVPGLIAGANIKSHTGDAPYGRDIGLGTGHWALKLNLAWVKSSDPVIFFGGVGYTNNIKRDINGFGEVNPGDTFEYSLGLAFALNYQAAVSFQVEQFVTTMLEIESRAVSGSFTNVANFKGGVTYSLTKDLSVDITTSIGLTEDSPDYVLEARLPCTF